MTGKRSAFFLIFCLGLFCACQSTNTVSDDEYLRVREQALTAVRKPIHPFLWKLERGGKISYAFGTYHLGLKVPPELLKKYFLPSDCIVLEITDQQPVNLETLMRDAPRNTSNKTYKELLTSSEYQNLEHSLGREIGNHYNTYAPGVVAFLFQMERMEELHRNLGLGIRGIDEQLLEKATELQKKRFALDDSQTVRPLAKTLFKGQLQDLVKVLHNPRAMDLEIYRFLIAYTEGDEKLVDNAVLDASEDDKEDLQTVARRDSTWIEKISKIHSTCNQSFIGVGTAHWIYGKDNLLDRLRREGFRITRL